jgi:hypothetical protein
MAIGRGVALCICLPIIVLAEDVVLESSSSPALELLQRKANMVHAQTQDLSKTTKTTTASASGVGANGVGNLPTFITGLCTDFIVIAICVYLFSSFSARYPILFGKGTMNPTKGGDEPEQVPETVITKMNRIRDYPMFEKEDGKWMPCNKYYFDFARVSWNLDYNDIAGSAGLDKAMLIMFIEKCCRAFKWIAIPMFFITGPINCFFGGNAAGEDHESWFSLGNVEFYSKLYWITGFACCYVAWCVCNFICIDGMKEFQTYRKIWLLQMDDRRSKTLMMTGIPEDKANETECKKFWDQLTDNKVDYVYITKDVDLKYYEVDPEKPDPEFSELASSPNNYLTLHKMIAQREVTKVALDAAVHDDKPDLKEQCERDLAQLEKDILLMRKWTNKNAATTDGTGYFNLTTGFITFKDRVTTESALKMNLGNHWQTWVMEKAPEPVDIIWSDFTEDPTAGGARAMLGYALTFGMMCIYMPLVVAIANVAEAINLGPFQMIWSSEAPSIGLTIMVDFLPTLLVLIFTNCFSVYDRSGQQMKLSVWYFWMNMLFVVMVTAIGTSFLSFVKTVANDPLKIFHLLATTMPNCTHYYMNYLGMQWYSMAMQLTRYIGVIKYRIFVRHHDEEEARDLSEPEDQDYYGIGSRTARFSTLVTIGIVFGTLSPPCMVLAWLTVLWIRTLFGYQFTFNETKKPDLGGAYAARAFHNVYCALHIYFVLMCGVLYVRGNDSGPCIISLCGWIYVFISQGKFTQLKWEYVEVDHLFTPEAQGVKRRALHGKYQQPEMYDDDVVGLKATSNAARATGMVSDMKAEGNPGVSGLAGRFGFGEKKP